MHSQFNFPWKTQEKDWLKPFFKNMQLMLYCSIMLGALLCPTSTWNKQTSKQAAPRNTESMPDMWSSIHFHFHFSPVLLIVAVAPSWKPCTSSSCHHEKLGLTEADKSCVCSQAHTSSYRPPKRALQMKWIVIGMMKWLP